MKQLKRGPSGGVEIRETGKRENRESGEKAVGV